MTGHETARQIADRVAADYDDRYRHLRRLAVRNRLSWSLMKTGPEMAKAADVFAELSGGLAEFKNTADDVTGMAAAWPTSEVLQRLMPDDVPSAAGWHTVGLQLDRLDDDGAPTGETKTWSTEEVSLIPVTLPDEDRLPYKGWRPYGETPAVLRDLSIYPMVPISNFRPGDWSDKLGVPANSQHLKPLPCPPVQLKANLDLGPLSTWPDGLQDLLFGDAEPARAFGYQVDPFTRPANADRLPLVYMWCADCGAEYPTDNECIGCNPGDHHHVEKGMNNWVDWKSNTLLAHVRYRNERTGFDWVHYETVCPPDGIAGPATLAPLVRFVSSVVVWPLQTRWV